MTYDTFVATLDQSAPPADASQALLALWHDAKGDWQRAHACAQAQDDPSGAWVHAYLHRKEGDGANAGYWYRRAAKPHCKTSLQDEWTALARALAQ